MTPSLKLFFLSFLLFGLIACNPGGKKLKFEDETVSFEGRIVDYKSVYKTGKLTYFDAITRVVNHKIFPIDSLGSFDFSIHIPHALLNNVFFDLEGNFYSDFMIEPGKEYHILIRENEMMFRDSSGYKNRILRLYFDDLKNSFGQELERYGRLHEEALTVQDYIAKKRAFEGRMLDSLDAFFAEYQNLEDLKRVLQSDIRFDAAKSWICYRMDYSKGFPMPRISLPDEFYPELFKEYQLESVEDMVSRNGTDYISNVVDVLSREKMTSGKRMRFVERFSLFSPDELEMLRKLYQGDRSIGQSEKYKRFNTKHKYQLLEINQNYYVHELLENIDVLPKGLMKDLVISQGIAKYLFENNLKPGPSIWAQVNQKIANPSISAYLKKYAQAKTGSRNAEESVPQPDMQINLDKVLEKYLYPYRGKIIYIDFYSTWCGPCRYEIPFAKQLHAEFEGKDVVFLNLCAKSKSADWENMLKQQEIGGENFLLNDYEFNLLSKKFNVEGFPTYIIMDKQGRVVEEKALRPSAKEELYEILKNLL